VTGEHRVQSDWTWNTTYICRRRALGSWGYDYPPMSPGIMGNPCCCDADMQDVAADEGLFTRSTMPLLLVRCHRQRLAAVGAAPRVSPPLAPPLGSHHRRPQALLQISAGKVSPPLLTLGTPPDQRWQGLAVAAALAPRHFSGSALGSWRFSSDGTSA